jgi:hypothetical protein
MARRQTEENEVNGKTAPSEAWAICAIASARGFADVFGSISVVSSGSLRVNLRDLDDLL